MTTENENDKNWLNKVTKNYPNNPHRPLEISQATYETLLLIFMNDMSAGTKFFGIGSDTTSNEYMKALGTFIVGEPIGEYMWPLNWLKLVKHEFDDLKKWVIKVYTLSETDGNKYYIGNLIEAMIKRTVLQSAKFDSFLVGGNPVSIKYANKEAGSQRPLPLALTTRRVIEPLIIPYRTTGMFGDCSPRSPVNTIEGLKKWYECLHGDSGMLPQTSRMYSIAFMSSMVDFYKSNTFPDPELFLPYMIALSPSIKNAQLAISEYEDFVQKAVCPSTTNDAYDPILSSLMGKQVPSIPNFEKNYLLLAEKFNSNRDYLKIAVGPIIQNMILPIAVGFGIFASGSNPQDLRKDKYDAQINKAHELFTIKQPVWVGARPMLNQTTDKEVRFWQANFKDLNMSYQKSKLFYYPHWLYACSSRYLKANAALRDRDFVVINVEDPNVRAYLVRWCNIKGYLTRDECDMAVLLGKSYIKERQFSIKKLHVMAFEDYIQMIPRPSLDVAGVLKLARDKKLQASFKNCFEKVCTKPSGVCYPVAGITPAPLPEL